MQTQFRYAGMPESRTRISVVMPNSSAPVVVQIAVGVEDLDPSLDMDLIMDGCPGRSSGRSPGPHPCSGPCRR